MFNGLISKVYKEYLIIPNVPNFNNKAANIIDPIVGASLWAKGNQVWKGNIGILIKKEKNKNIQIICNILIVDISKE